MSQATIHNSTVYLAGQVAINALEGDVTVQTMAILSQADALFSKAGTTRHRLLSATIWLADMGDFGAMNEVWDAWLPVGCAPARATVEARLALPQFRVEIAFVAAV